MTYKGIVRNNSIILNPPISLPEGTVVEITPILQSEEVVEDAICGSWQDDRSAEEIIHDIKSSRQSREKEIKL